MSHYVIEGSQQNQVQFVNVQDFPLIMKHIRAFFSEDIAPLYGNQTKALKKIEKGVDRTCEVLVSVGTQEELGVVVYKNDLTEEYAGQGYAHTFEIKTLVVLNSKRNAGKRVASYLLYYLVSKAVSLKAKAITITVSSSKPETLAFCLKYGFEIEKHAKNHYVQGLDEFFLFHPHPEKLLSSVFFEVSAKGNNHQTKIEKKFSDRIEFSPFEELFLRTYFQGKSHIDALKVVNSYFGIELDTMFINKTLSYLRLHHFKWQTDGVAENYIILFINPLYESSENMSLIGYVFVGIQSNGKREILGTCLPVLHQKPYWVDLFKDLKLQGLDQVDIICIPREIKLSFKDIEALYGEARIVTSTALKSWSAENFIPFSLGQDLVDEMVSLCKVCFVEQASAVVATV